MTAAPRKRAIVPPFDDDAEARALRSSVPAATLDGITASVSSRQRCAFGEVPRDVNLFFTTFWAST